MKYYIGLDLGINGGVVVLRENGEVEEVFKNPNTTHGWLEKLKPYTDKHCFCITEKVHSMPSNGGKANFTFGFNVSKTLTMLEVCNVPYQEVTPQAWMKSFSMKKDSAESKTAWKNRLKELAAQLFPKEKVTLWSADAFLMAEYCRRNFR